MPGSLLPQRGILEIQQGGAGASNWKPLAIISDITQVRMGAFDSTEVEISRNTGRDERTGSLVNLNSWRSGAPETFSGDLEIAEVKLRAFLETLAGLNNFRVRRFSGEYSVFTNYEKIYQLSRAWNKKPASGAFSRDMVNSFEGKDAPADAQRRTFPLEADGYLELDPVTRQKISGTVTTLGITDAASVGYPRYAGQIPGETENNPGNREYLFVTLKDVSNLPHVFWTANKGASWVDNTGTGLTNFDGSGICKAGALVVISGTGVGGGLAYAEFELVKAGTATWTRSTNIAAGTVINSVRAIDAQTIIACGPAGAVYISTDGGRSFVSAGAAVTANALTKIAIAGPDLQWFGTNTGGSIVRRYKDVMSLVSVSGLAAAVNSIAVPTGLGRLTEIFLGAADGKVYAAPNGTATAPTFTIRREGASAIDALAFAGPDGDLLYAVETNGSSQSRVIRDLSGGRFASDAEILGSYIDPTNSTINALAAADANTVLAVGDVNGGQGYIELIA